MKALRLLIGLFAVVPMASAEAQSIAIVHAKAWTGMGDTAVGDATIVVRDGRIVSIAQGAPAPAGLEVIEAGGKFVTPGFFSGATQIGLVEVAGAADTADEAVDSGKLGAAFDIAPAINDNSLLIEQARSDGILWALTFPSGSATPPFLGQAALLRLREGAALEQARAAVFARIGGNAATKAGGSRAAAWILLRRALDEARLLQAARLPPPDDRLFNRIDLESLQQVVSGQVPLAIQTDRASDIREALRLKRDYRIMVVLVGAAEAWTAAKELAAEKVPVILDPAANLPINYDAIGARLDNAAILDKAGVTLAIATTANSIDSNYNVGISSRMAAGIAVANGLPYGSAIRALTSGPASIWQASAKTGSIAPGKLADLIIWDGDPLEPSSAPIVTLIGGHIVSTVTREQQLTRRYSPIRPDKQWPPAYR